MDDYACSSCACLLMLFIIELYVGINMLDMIMVLV